MYFNYKFNCYIDNMKLNSYFFAFIHAISTILLCIYNLQLQYEILPNNTLQNIIICNSLSYFITDLVKCYITQDYMYIIHHLLSILFLSSIYIIQIGGNTVQIGLLVFEINNPLLHIGWFMKTYNYNNYEIVWKIHSFIFFVTRLVYSPIIFINFYQSFSFFYQKLFLLIYSMLYSGSFFWFVKQIKSYLK